MFNTVTNMGLWVPGQTVTVTFQRWGNFHRKPSMQTPYVSYPDINSFGRHFYHDLLLGYRERLVGPDLYINRILWTKAQINAFYATTADNKQDSLNSYSCLAVQDATDSWPEDLIDYSDDYLDIVSITPTYDETFDLETSSNIVQTDYQRLYRFFSLKGDGSGDPWPVYWEEKMESDVAPVSSVDAYIYDGEINDRIKHFHNKMVEIYGVSSGINDLPITYSDLGTVHSNNTITDTFKTLPKHLVTITFRVKDSFTMPSENLYLFVPSWDCWWDFYVSMFPIWKYTN